MPKGSSRAGIREKARLCGEFYYDTGKPCKWGHMAKRYVRTGSCVACDAERGKKWREDNPDRYRLIHHKNVEKDREYSRQYSTKNKECLSAKAKERYHADIAASRKKASNYAKKLRKEKPHIEKARKAFRRDRIRKSMPKYANRDRIRAIYMLRPKGYHVDHIVPLKGRDRVTGEHVICGLHVDGNLQYLSVSANTAKNNSWSGSESYDSNAIVPFSWDHFLVISEQATWS